VNLQDRLNRAENFADDVATAIAETETAYHQLVRDVKEFLAPFEKSENEQTLWVVENVLAIVENS
jgi:hypothetical protein